MRKRSNEIGEDWDEYVYAAMAIGGYTPFQLRTGRSPSLPDWRRSPAVKDSTAKEYLRNFMKARGIAQRELHAYNMEQGERRRYYQPGQLMWCDRRAGAKTHGAKVHKLEATKRGPYEVIKQGYQNSYYLKAEALLDRPQGTNARHVEYRPGSLEMMTRSTIDRRLELHQDDPDALTLNAVVVNGGKRNYWEESYWHCYNVKTTQRKL